MRIKKIISIVLASLLAKEIIHDPWDLVNAQPHIHQDIMNHDDLNVSFDLPSLTTSAASSYWGPIFATPHIKQGNSEIK